MKYIALKTFPYSSDGIKIYQATEGKEMNPSPPERVIPGLVKEGYIKPAEEHEVYDPREQTKVVESAPETKDENHSPNLEAIDVGSGWFAIHRDGVEVTALKKMRKDDAEKFNNLSQEEKSAFVTSHIG